MRALPLLSLLILIGCQSSRPSLAVPGVAVPTSWPISQLSLPTGSQAGEFQSPAPDGPQKWEVEFNYTENPKEVFSHFEKVAEKLKWKEADRLTHDPLGPQDSRRVEWLTSDGKWTVSASYYRANTPNPYSISIKPKAE